MRERLGIEPGTELEFDDEGGRLVARKATATDPLGAVTGIIDLPAGGTDELIRDLRGDAEDD